MATWETLLVDRPRTGIAVATLNRPDRLNALTFQMFDELARLAADIAADDRVRVLVLTGPAADSAPAWISPTPPPCRI